MTRSNPSPEALRAALAIEDWHYLWHAAIPLVAGAIRAMLAKGTIYGDLDLEDLGQEAITAVGAKLPAWDPMRGAFSTFVYSHAQGAVLNYINRESRADEPTDALAIEFLPDARALTPIGYDDPALELDRDRLTATLPAALESLTARQREIIEARFGLDGEDELSVREVMARTGETERTVKRETARALAVLREA